MTRERMDDIVEINALFASNEDTAMSYLVESDTVPSGILGVWPHYAAMTHSCAPNTISYVMGGQLITRASR